MYVATFYSYKGGVGRTMALVNTAVELARTGQRVLIVDFDLEAPGISTYDHFKAASDGEGVVDYVVRYRDTGEAPSVMDYIVECSVLDDGASFPLFVMPAGKAGKGYSAKFHSIDWNELYSKDDGYLMFEDLKQQWKQFGQFQYVLIDSRTGHTDIGGICTRQLPDAVVLMFYPNNQNIDGLAVVVDEIRQQRVSAIRQQQTPKRIRLLFCPSNVPEGDDEDDIRAKQLRNAQEKLKYEEPAAIITHYNSLELLNQEIFVTRRKKTRLARQYAGLTKMIRRGNLEDKEGASTAIDAMRRYLRGRGNDDAGHYRRARPVDVDFSEMSLSKTLAQIQDHHPRDSQLALGLAAVYRDMGDLASEYNALTIAIEEKPELVNARLSRARNLANQGGRGGEAVEDLRAAINSSEAGPPELVQAMAPLRRLEPEKWVDMIASSKAWLDVIASSTPTRGVSMTELLPIADRLAVDKKGTRLAAELLLAQRAVRGNGVDDELESILVMSLIGSGRFVEAKDVLTSRHRSGDVKTWPNVRDVFNYAMADWGHHQKPPLEMLRRVVSLAVPEARGVNYFQCMALVHAVLGQTRECRENISRAQDAFGPGLEFSCWRYLKVTRADMAQDLRAIEKGCEARTVHPPFLRQAETVH